MKYLYWVNVTETETDVRLYNDFGPIVCTTTFFTSGLCASPKP